MPPKSHSKTEIEKACVSSIEVSDIGGKRPKLKSVKKRYAIKKRRIDDTTALDMSPDFFPAKKPATIPQNQAGIVKI